MSLGVGGGDKFKYDSSLPVVYFTVIGILLSVTLLQAIYLHDTRMIYWSIFYGFLAFLTMIGTIYMLSNPTVIEPTQPTFTDILSSTIYELFFIFTATIITSIAVSVFTGKQFVMLTWGQYGVMGTTGKISIPAYITVDTRTLSILFYNMFVAYTESGLFHNTLPYIFASTKSEAYLSAILSNTLFGIMHIFAYQNIYLLPIAVFAGLAMTWGAMYLSDTYPAQQGVSIAHMLWNILTVLFSA